MKLRGNEFFELLCKKRFKKKKYTFISIHSLSLFFIFSSLPIFTSICFQMNTTIIWVSILASTSILERDMSLHTDTEEFISLAHYQCFPTKDNTCLFIWNLYTLGMSYNFLHISPRCFLLRLFWNGLHFYCHC